MRMVSWDSMQGENDGQVPPSCEKCMGKTRFFGHNFRLVCSSLFLPTWNCCARRALSCHGGRTNEECTKRKSCPKNVFFPCIFRNLAPRAYTLTWGKLALQIAILDSRYNLSHTYNSRNNITQLGCSFATATPFAFRETKTEFAQNTTKIRLFD